MSNSINLGSWKHYEKLPDNYFRLWSIDKCEDCGGEAEAPNSIQVGARGLVRDLKRAGLTERTCDVGELGYSDAFGGAVCPDCYSKNEKPLKKPTLFLGLAFRL